ncbi:393_t:CDS:2, partial [Paraglomus brasilianum]
MERFENWLNQNQGLSPRTDKSHDRDQHVDSGSIDTSDKENVCPECSHSSPQHSPQCSHNQSNPHPTRQPKPGQKSDITNDPKKTAELNRLKKLIQTSRDLSTLETTYQNIKVNPLYQGKNRDDNKKELDDLYQLQKELLRSQQNLTNDPNSLNKGELDWQKDQKKRDEENKKKLDEHKENLKKDDKEFDEKNKKKYIADIEMDLIKKNVSGEQLSQKLG